MCIKIFLDTNKRISEVEYLVKCEIEDQPVVNSVGFLAASGKNKAGVYANLRCHATSLGVIQPTLSVRELGGTQSSLVRPMS